MTSKNPALTTPGGDATALLSRAQSAAHVDDADEAPPSLATAKAKGKPSTLLIERQYTPDQDKQIEALLCLLQGPRSTGALREGINEPRLGGTNSTADDMLSQGQSSASEEEPEHDRHRTPS